MSERLDVNINLPLPEWFKNKLKVEAKRRMKELEEASTHELVEEYFQRNLEDNIESFLGVECPFGDWRVKRNSPLEQALTQAVYDYVEDKLPGWLEAAKKPSESAMVKAFSRSFKEAFEERLRELAQEKGREHAERVYEEAFLKSVDDVP